MAPPQNSPNGPAPVGHGPRQLRDVQRFALADASKLTGRRAEYSRIREAEIRAEYSQQTGPHTAPQIAQHVAETIPITPAPFTALALRPLEVSLITRMRCHMSSCIRTHIGHQTHVLRGTRYPPIHYWHLLTCVYCNGSCLDDNAHFFLHCPFHAAARLLMLQAIHTATIQAGANFRWAEYDRFPMVQVHTLLGVGDQTVALRAADNGLLTKIVRAAAKFVLRATRERTSAV